MKAATVSPMSEPAPVKSLDCAAGAVPQQVFESTEPVLLQGLASKWPAVAGCSGTIADAARYLSQFWREEPVTVYAGDSSIDGRFFYNEDFTGFNFIAAQAKPSIGRVFAKLAEPATERSVCRRCTLGSTPIDKWMPGFQCVRNDVQLPTDDALASSGLGNPATRTQGIRAHVTNFPTD